MKKILAFVLALVVGSMTAGFVSAQDDLTISGNVTISGNEAQYVNPFSDVSKDAWYYESVMYACTNGLINGKTATTFCPDDNLTYAEALKLAACMHQRYTEGKVTLTNGDPWYQPYVDYCRENKITKKDYNYSENATRAGYMEIFAKALPEEALEIINDIEENSIPDVPSSEAYADGIYLLYGAGVVAGVDDKHNCDPTANIKRAEVAVIVHRMMIPEKRVRFDLKSVYGSIIDNDIDIAIDGNKSVNIVFPDGSEITLPDNVEIKDKKESVEIVFPDGTEMMLPDNVKIYYGNESIEIVIPDGSQLTLPDNVEIKNGNESVEIIFPDGSEMTLPDGKVEFPDDDTVTITPGNREPIISNDGNITFYPVYTPAQTIYLAVTIVKQPKNYEADKYGIKTELEVEVKGGKEPYKYEWYYYAYRNEKVKIENGDYAKDADSAALVISVEKGNPLLGNGIFCRVTDADGISTDSDRVTVYGPFSMSVEGVEIKQAAREYVLAGTVADGRLAKGDKISVVRNGKIIAIGTATDLQRFGKSLDEASKGDTVGVTFVLSDGVRPMSGDLVIKFKDDHIIDTSDIIN